MDEQRAPDDLDVELQWPDVEAPTPPQRESNQVPTKAAGRAAPLPSRTAPKGGAGEEFARRIEMLARAVQRLDPSREVRALGSRIDELNRTIEGERKAETKRAADLAKKTGAQLTDLAKRIDAVAATVEKLPAGSALAELVGKVDALSTTVELLCANLGSVTDGYEQLRHQVEVAFEPLRDATTEVHRLSDIVVTRGDARSGRQSELHSQVEQLADDIRELRRGLPVGKGSRDADIVGAVTEAVIAALSSGDAPVEAKPAPRRRRAKPASTANA